MQPGTTRVRSRFERLFVTCVLALVLAAALAATGCGRSAQTRETAFLKRGRALAAKGDQPRARLEFRNAAEAMPKDAEPHYQMGLTYLAEANPASAVAEFQKTLELSPNHAGAKAQTAKLASEEGRKALLQDIAKALKDIQGSMESADVQDGLALGDALVKLSRSDLDGAIELLKAAVAHETKSSKLDWAFGQIYFLLGRFDEAEGEIQKYLRIDPKNGEALVALASSQIAGQRFEEADQTYRRVSALPGKKYKPLHAAFLHLRGQLAAAQTEYEQLYRADPGDPEARQRLVGIYEETDKTQEALTLLSQSVKEHPADPNAYMARGELLMRLDKLDEAEQDARQALQLKANSEPAYILLAAVQRRKRLATPERATLREALRGEPRRIEVRLQLAKSLLRDNDALEALDVLNQAPAEQAKIPEVIAQKNWALLVLSRNDEAQANLDAALRRDWTTDMVVQEAVVQLRRKNYPDARSSAEEALKEMPGDERAASVLTWTYVRQNQSAEGIKRLSAIAAAHPESAPLQYLLGEWYLKSGKSQESRAAFETARSADPSFQQADLALADLDSGDNPDAARRRLSAILRAEPKNIGAMLLFAGVEEKAGDRAAARAKYRSVLEIDATNLVALNNLAYLLALDNPEGALKLAQQAAQIAPKNPAIEDTLGWVYYRKGQYGAAIEALKSAVAQAPTPQREFHLGMSYLKAGDKGTGQKMVAAALQKDPNLPKKDPGW